MFRGLILFLLGVMVCGEVAGQADRVAACLLKVKATEEDSIRLVYADEIPAFLEKIEFGQYPDLPPVQYLGYRKCVNEEVELFSWVIPLARGQMYYNWFRFKADHKVYFTKSFSDEKGEQVGWLYYDLIGFKNQGTLYFALLGWNKTRKTNQKIVQICRFGSNGKISFNHRLMRRGNSRSAALSFEYALEGSMMLKQDKKGKRIIFDHLAPTEKKYEGYFMFYGPDASYDALVLKGGVWWYEENVKS